MLRVLKIVGLLLGGLVLLVMLFFGRVTLRKSVPYFLPGDIEQLASSGPYNNSALASRICGTAVDKYRLWRPDNGRAVVLEKQFVELPKVVR